ncbi:adenosine deaminase [Myriangium duriaei CBS 260.36]|uniref:Adenine deaminase n=1 Tax=Myriangium duriaei CBS 260.36 TaxID=1168546 RepID=A0A9P4MD59_9PEZI|nr:adenosine deaminase [Myriangium duriaei CBS 260.36]
MPASDFKPADEAFLRSLPKCEHHLHIEGALSPEVLFRLATRNSIPLPSPSSDPAYTSPTTLAQRYKSFTSLDDFLAYYYRGMAVLLHPADYEDLTYAYLARAHSEGVRHAEVFFDPQAHLERGVDFDTVLSGMRAGCAKAEAEFGTSTLIIPCFLRHLPADDAWTVLQSEAFRAAAERREFVGIGLDSSEAGFPIAPFEKVWRATKGMGLRLTAHAGEEGGAENIAEALRVGCERIDHGVRIVEDAELVERVAREKIMLSVCPLSNVALRVKKSVAEVPIREFLDRGVRFSINSDDPEYLGGYILDSYVAVQEAFGLSRDEWKTICRYAIEGSWCGQDRKDVLLGMLKEI